MICTFFGHRDTPDTVRPLLREVLLDLIEHHDAKQFYVGNQGNFDAMALRLVKEFEKPYSITYDIVITYVERPFGGAAKYKALAEKKNKVVIELSGLAFGN